MTRHLALHARHAVLDRFDPKVLEGRDILKSFSASRHDSRDRVELGMHVIVEGATIPAIGKIFALHSPFKIIGEDRRMYTDSFKVVGFDSSGEHGQSVPMFKKGEERKLLTTRDGQVVGVLAGINQGLAGTYIHNFVCADDMVNPPYHHVRESLKGKFDTAVLQGRRVDGASPIKTRLSALAGLTKVYIEGQDVLSRNSIGLEHIAKINGKSYTESLVVETDAMVSPKAPLTHLFAQNALFSTPEDVGKLVMMKQGDEEIVVGVVAGSEEAPQNVRDQTYWRQKTFIAPAADFLIE